MALSLVLVVSMTSISSETVSAVVGVPPTNRELPPELVDVRPSLPAAVVAVLLVGMVVPFTTKE